MDAYPGDVEGEGDPVALAEARARSSRSRSSGKPGMPMRRDRLRGAWHALRGYSAAQDAPASTWATSGGRAVLRLTFKETDVLV